MRYSNLQAESKGTPNAVGEKKRTSASSSQEDLSEGERERRGARANEKAGLGPVQGQGQGAAIMEAI